MSNKAFQQNLDDKKGPQPGGPYPAVSNRIMKRFTTSLTISKQRLETISKFGSNTMNILKKKRKS